MLTQAGTLSLGFLVGVSGAALAQEVFVEETATCQFTVVDDPADWPEFERDWNTVVGFAGVASWNVGTMGVGYGNTPTDRFDPWMNSDVRFLMSDVQTASLFVRIPFDVQGGQQTIDQLSRLVLHARFDDGLVAYLNGVEVQRFNAPHELSFDSRATAIHRDSDAEIPIPFDISEHIDLLLPGENVLALQVLNGSPVNGDLLASVELIGDNDAAPLPASEGVLAISEIVWSEAAGRFNRLMVRVVRGRVYELQHSPDMVEWQTRSTVFVRDGGADPTPTIEVGVGSPYGPYLRVIER